MISSTRGQRNETNQQVIRCNYRFRNHPKNQHNNDDKTSFMKNLPPDTTERRPTMWVKTLVNK